MGVVEPVREPQNNPESPATNVRRPPPTNPVLPAGRRGSQLLRAGGTGDDGAERGSGDGPPPPPGEPRLSGAEELIAAMAYVSAALISAWAVSEAIRVAMP